MLRIAVMLMQNVRLAVRSFAKRPALFAALVAVIAVGVGANTAIFTIVDAVLLRPLPYPDPDRLALLLGTSGVGSGSISVLDFRDLVERSRSFEAAAIYGPAALALADGESADTIAGFRVSASLFAVLGTPPARGRGFSPESDRGSAPWIVLGDGLWRRRFGADVAIVGTTIRVNGSPRTVVGVMPAGFAFPEGAEAWVPLELTSNERRPGNRGAHFLSAIVRVKRGVTVAQSRDEVEGIGAALAREYPETNADRRATLAPAAARMVESARPALMLLSGAVAFVLLIACANVSNLLLLRAAARRKEIAIRRALGASRRQIVAQLLAEVVIVGIAAAVAGLLLGAWIVRASIALLPADLPHAQNISVDGRVLAFTTLLSLVATAACGLFPALAAAGATLADAVREGRASGTARAGARRVFVVAEVALALVLLIGAAASLRGLRALSRVDPGFRAERVLSARIALPRTQYEPAHAVETVAQLLTALRAQAGIVSAAAVAIAPFEPRGFGGSFRIEGIPRGADSDPSAQVRAITDGYFQTMGVTLLRGRAIEIGDTAASKGVAVVSESTARRYWADADPIGRHLTLDIGVVPGPSVEREVVGVVRDVMLRRGADQAAVIYVPHRQYPAAGMTVVARTAGADPLAALPALRHELAQLDRDLGLQDVHSMSERMAGSAADVRFRTLLLSSFGAVALALAMVGLYAVVAYSTAQRAQEIGIRIALGALPAQILWLVFREGMTPVAIGAVLGVAGVTGLSRLLSGMLFGAATADPATVAAGAALLTVAALVACYVPARRALAVSPLDSLRVD